MKMAAMKCAMVFCAHIITSGENAKSGGMRPCIYVLVRMICACVCVCVSMCVCSIIICYMKT
jgi:hypothetical protein